MADVTFLQVPVEVGLELRAIVCLDNEHPEGTSTDNLVHEADGFDFWLHTSYILSTRMRVQSSMAVN